VIRRFRNLRRWSCRRLKRCCRHPSRYRPKRHRPTSRRLSCRHQNFPRLKCRHLSYPSLKLPHPRSLRPRRRNPVIPSCRPTPSHRLLHPRRRRLPIVLMIRSCL